MILPIKPLSANKMYKGRKVKTVDYRRYEEDMALILPRAAKEMEGDIFFLLIAHVTRNGDVDNIVKAFQDCLEKKGYMKNDRQVRSLLVHSVDEKPGKEYIEFYLLDRGKWVDFMVNSIKNKYGKRNKKERQ